jgi:hypothetical protein
MSIPPQVKSMAYRQYFLENNFKKWYTTFKQSRRGLSLKWVLAIHSFIAATLKTP